MSDLGRRLKRLEGESGRATPCSGCGFAPGEPAKWGYRWIDRPDLPGDDRPENCPECGRLLVIPLTWGDGPGGGTTY